MKQTALAVIAFLVLVTPVMAQTSAVAMPEKDSPTTGETAYDGRIEGDTIEECLPIASLPFTAAGSSCDYLHDYDEACPYGGSYSQDVVYCYEPPYDMCVDISLCNSFYDTKVYVYGAGYTPGLPYACNDDNFDCVDPPVMYTSLIPGLQLYAGDTYYVVIDGYGNSCGDYVLEIEEVDCHPPCDIVCVGVPEGEPTCYDEYEDVYNGGCATDSYSLISVSPEPLVYCGESGIFNYEGSLYRDTDWFLIYPCTGNPITVTVEAEFDVLLAFVDLRGGCENMYIYSYVQAYRCEPAVVSEYLPMGQYAIFVAPDEWLPEYECGIEYSMVVEGYTEHCDPTPVEIMSWGKVKALYR